jgi:GAF domain-containing protein
METFGHVLDQSSNQPLPPSSELTRAHDDVLDVALQIFGCEIGVLFPINPLNHEFGWPPRVRGNLIGDFPFKQPRPDGLGQKILGYGTIKVGNLRNSTRFSSDFAVAQGIESFIATTIYLPSGRHPLAVVYIDYRRTCNFDETDESHVRQFRARAAAMIQRAWVLERYERLSALGDEINQQLLTPKTLFKLLNERLHDIIDCRKRFALGVVGPASDSVSNYISTAREVLEEEQRPLTALDREAIMTGSIARLPIRDGGTAQIFVPMLLRKLPLGYLALEPQYTNDYDSEDLRVIQVLRNHVATALDGIRLFEDLTTISTVAERLNDQVTSADPLPAFAEDLRRGAHADLVTLYSWSASEGFVLPPTIAGKLLAPEFGQPTTCSPDDIPSRAIRCDEAIFCDDAATLPREIGLPELPSTFTEREKIASAAAIPLRVSGLTVGVLFVNFRTRQRFAGPQMRLVTSLAGFAATALHSARRFSQQEGDRARELEIIRRVDSALARSTFEEVAKTIITLANGVVQAELAELFLVDSKRKTIKLVDGVGPKSQRLRGWSLPLQGTSEGIVRWVVENRKPVLVNDRRTEEPWKNLFIGESDTVSELDVPLLDGEEVIGVLNFESPTPHAFSKTKLRFVETIAGQSVLAVKRARDYELLAAQALILKAIQDISKQVLQLRSGDPTEVLKAVVTHALKLTRSIRSDLDVYANKRLTKTYYCDMTSDGVSAVGEVPLDPWPEGKVRGIMAHVAKARRPYYTKGDALEDPYYRPGIPDIHSELAVPLLARTGELLGVLNVESREIYAYNEEMQDVLQLLADEAAIAFENASSKDVAEREGERSKALVEIGDELAMITTEDYAKACEIVSKAAARHCSCVAAVRVRDAQSNDLMLVSWAGGTVQPFERIRAGEGLAGRAVETCKLQRADDLSNPSFGSPPAKPSDPNTRSLLIAPILMHDFCYGTLGVSHPEPYHFGVPEENLIRGLARLLGLTFHRFESLRREITEKRKEVISLTAHAALDLMHQLSPLSLVKSYVNDAFAAATNKDEKSLSEELERIRAAVEKVIARSTEIGSNMDRLKNIYPAAVSVFDIVNSLDVMKKLPSGIEFEQSGGANVYADRDHIESILENVISNAIDAMQEKGRIGVTVTVTGPTVTIDVDDTGPGIAGDPEKIFEFGYTTKLKHGGGIGLWSARARARVNSGDLRVVRTSPQGTVFRLMLPSADPDWRVRFERVPSVPSSLAV